MVALVWLFSCGKQESEPEAADQHAADTTEAKTSVIVAVGKVEPELGIVNLSAQAGGMVEAVYKKDGDTISQGAVLVQLDDDLEQSKINEINMQIRSQRSQIDIEQTQLREAEINLGHKRSLLASTRRLVENGAETQQTYDDLNTEVKVLEVSLERLNAKIQYATGRLNELTAQLKTAETEAAKKKFISPADGILLDMQINKGESVNPLTAFAEFAPQGRMIVRAEVDELFSAEVKAGQKVEIVNTGSDRVLSTGEVIRVSPCLKKKSLFSERADDQEDRRVREISVAITDASNLILNAKVECIIKL